MDKFAVCNLIISEVNGFSFFLPRLTDSGNSIHFTIEYGHITETSLEFNVWLQVGDSTMRGFIYQNSIPYERDAIQQILDTLNNDNLFMDTLQEYIDILELYTQNMV